VKNFDRQKKRKLTKGKMEAPTLMKTEQAWLLLLLMMMLFKMCFIS
jgi:hypothetical protein